MLSIPDTEDEPMVQPTITVTGYQSGSLDYRPSLVTVQSDADRFIFNVQNELPTIGARQNDVHYSDELEFDPDAQTVTMNPDKEGFYDWNRNGVQDENEQGTYNQTDNSYNNDVVMNFEDYFSSVGSYSSLSYFVPYDFG